MPRNRSPNREKAKELWLESNKNRLLKDIASELGVSETQVRKWKNQDDWDGKNKVTLPKEKSKSKSNVTKQKNISKKKPSSKIDENNITPDSEESTSSKINLINVPNRVGAPLGNRNALGNPGGGAPMRNRNAERTGEFVTIYFDDLNEHEQKLIKLSNDTDYYEKLLMKDAGYTILEKQMRLKINELKSKPGGMQIRSVATQKSETKGGPFDGQIQNQSTTEAVFVSDEILKREQALANVMDKHAKIIVQLHRIQMDEFRMSMDLVKLDILKQRISGRIDLETLLEGEDICDDLDETEQ